MNWGWLLLDRGLTANDSGTNDLAAPLGGIPMHRLAALTLAFAMAVAACGGEQPDPTPDLSAAVQYWFDFGGANIPAGDGQVAAGIGGWTSDFACAERPDPDLSRPDAVRFDDTAVPDWDLARDGGTPPPLTRSGTGVVLRVEPHGKGFYAVSLGVGGKTYTGTADADAATVGFHHVSYATPAEMLAIENMRLTAGDGSSITLTGTASFPMDCTGI